MQELFSYYDVPLFPEIKEITKEALELLSQVF